ncbi:MAG: hypothetical protein HY738_23935 [Bacteroidia bacterium]|nr:hypothetical protein [Bacteroidia bacterium]
MFKQSQLILLFLLTNLFVSESFSQYQDEVKPHANKKFDPSRLRYGGDFWLSFGRITSINASPKVGYQLTDRFVPGLGIIYQYYREEIENTYLVNNTTQTDKYLYKTTIYGGCITSAFILIQDFSKLTAFDIGSIIAYSEYQIINLDVYSPNSNGAYYDDGNRWINRFLIGGGIRQKISSHSSISLLILWDIINSQYSPYQNPTFQLGIAI